MKEVRGKPRARRAAIASFTRIGLGAWGRATRSVAATRRKTCIVESAAAVPR
jgi:hypothetical protein